MVALTPPNYARGRGVFVADGIQGTATVLVTHDRSHLTAVDQVVEIHDGRLRSPSRPGTAEGHTPPRRPAAARR